MFDRVPRQGGIVNSYLIVALGGAVGALLRFMISEWIEGPQSTLLVNGVGSFLLGACMAALANDLISKDTTIFLGTGILGAFTTMSTFSVDTIEIWYENQVKAICYVLFTMIFCPLLALVGWKAFGTTS